MFTVVVKVTFEVIKHKMNIEENLRKSLLLAVPDDIFRKLAENCFAALLLKPEPHNINNLFNSKPDLVKELYASLLSLTARFVRTGQNSDSVANFLTSRCSYSPGKTKLYADLYDLNWGEIEAGLINIGTHLPHVTDVTWKLDYIIKSSYSDHSSGPLFRVGLQTEKYDAEIGGKKTEFVSFTCDVQEMQDLVYKLKDAVRHCQRIGSDH